MAQGGGAEVGGGIGDVAGGGPRAEGEQRDVPEGQRQGEVEAAQTT